MRILHGSGGEGDELSWKHWNDSNEPFIFIVHNSCDKPLLVPFLTHVLADGVSVLIDNLYAFDQFDDYVDAGRLRQMGGNDWRAEIPRILHSGACACVLGFISSSAIDPDDPEAHWVTREEMLAAASLGRLVPVEIEPGAFDAFRNHPDLAHAKIGKVQCHKLRPERFAHDYDLLGREVASKTENRVRFGGRLSWERWAERQAALAQELCGSPSLVMINCFDDEHDRCFPCRLVPGSHAGGRYFWLTAGPASLPLYHPAEVLRLLADTTGFRLPSEEELEQALAPLGRDRPGANPFGFDFALDRDRFWVTSGRDLVVTGAEPNPPALVLLVYTEGYPT